MTTSVTLAKEEPLTLQECIKIALENNTSLLRAEASHKDTQLLKSVARADFMPSIGVGLGYNHTRVGASSQIFVDPVTGLQRPVQEGYTSRTYSSGISVSQTFYDGGYSIANYKKSRNDEKASRFNLESTRQMTIYNVEESCLALLKSQALLEVYRETIRSSEEALKKAQSMELIGAAPRSDVLKAKVKFESDKMRFIQAENEVEVARANLNYVLGFDVNRQTEVSDPSIETRWDLTYDEAVELAKDNHPELKKRNFEIESARNEIRMAKSSYLPQLTGSLNYSWYNEKLSNIGNMFDEDYNWTGRINLGISLFEGFSRPANVSRAKIGYKSLKILESETERNVLLEVKTAFLGMKAAEKQIEVANESLLSAEEDLKQSTTRYQLGAGTMLEQIDAQVAITSARANKIQADYDYRLAITRMKKSIGMLK